MDNLDNSTIKKVLIGVSAGLVAIAGIYYMTREVETREVVFDAPKETKKDIKPAEKQVVKTMPPPRNLKRTETSVPSLEKTSFGVLTKSAVLKVFDQIQKSLTIRYKEIHDQFITKRRACRDDKVAYANCAKEWHISQQKLNEDVFNHTFAQYNLEEKDIEKAIQTHREDPQIGEAMQKMTINFDKLIEETEIPESMTAEKFLEIYRTHAELKEEVAENSEAKSQLDILVIQAEVDDDLYDRFGYEDDVIRAATNKYQSEASCKEYTRRINAATKKLMDKVRANSK